MIINPSTTFTGQPDPVPGSEARAGTQSAAAVSGQPAIRMAYLNSRYPGVSHTFILREVEQLRQLGFDIGVASINTPDRASEDMTEFELSEYNRTYYIKRHGIGGALIGHLSGLMHPAAYLRGLWFALGMGQGNLKSMLYGLFYFTEALMVARWMRANGYTHLHVHFATEGANVGLVLHAFFPCTMSLTVHGPDEFYNAKEHFLREKIDAVDFMVCIGRFARSQVMKLSPGSRWHKFDICPLGVDPELFVPAPRKDEGQPFNILCVGRLTPAKGQRVLIDACRLLRDQGRSFRLVVVGAGPDENELKALVREYGLQDLVEFTGPLNQDQVIARYAKADAFALPSFAEGIPVVLMEAMASGVPCVTTRITGIPELIRDGIDGLLVTPSDSAELADALVALMDDPELRKDLARTGRERVVAEYHLSHNVDRLAETFKRRFREMASC
jgi:colanic acid/amylovoran biosynthesis glycosyltransferase